MSKFSILSSRSYEKRSWFDIVFEWEDVLEKVLGLEIIEEPMRFRNRWFTLLPFSLSYHLASLPRKSEYLIYFEMKSNIFHLQKNIKKIIPWVIDWYVDERYLWVYKLLYSRHKIMLISSREVFDYLNCKKWNIPTKHLALSLSDKYAITAESRFDKDYDIVLIGRQNPILSSFLSLYQVKHQNLTIYKPGPFERDTRDKYMKALSRARIVLYATPGTDDASNRTKGFSQVTPRFLEIIASGCHIIARYNKNSDTDFYELEKFSTSIDTFEQFELAMNKALSTDVDMKMYSEYLSKHYTSVRAKQLIEILNEL